MSHKQGPVVAVPTPPPTSVAPAEDTGNKATGSKEKKIWLPGACRAPRSSAATSAPSSRRLYLSPSAALLSCPASRPPRCRPPPPPPHAGPSPSTPSTPSTPCRHRPGPPPRLLAEGLARGGLCLCRRLPLAPIFCASLQPTQLRLHVRRHLHPLVLFAALPLLRWRGGVVAAGGQGQSCGAGARGVPASPAAPLPRGAPAACARPPPPRRPGRRRLPSLPWSPLAWRGACCCEMQWRAGVGGGARRGVQGPGERLEREAAYKSSQPTLCLAARRVLLCVSGTSNCVADGSVCTLELHGPQGDGRKEGTGGKAPQRTPQGAGCAKSRASWFGLLEVQVTQHKNRGCGPLSPGSRGGSRGSSAKVAARARGAEFMCACWLMAALPPPSGSLRVPLEQVHHLLLLIHLRHLRCGLALGVLGAQVGATAQEGGGGGEGKGLSDDVGLQTMESSPPLWQVLGRCRVGARVAGGKPPPSPPPRSSSSREASSTLQPNSAVPPPTPTHPHTHTRQRASPRRPQLPSLAPVQHPRHPPHPTLPTPPPTNQPAKGWSPPVQQQPRGVQHAIAGGIVEGGVVVLVPGVDVSACLDQRLRVGGHGVVGGACFSVAPAWKANRLKNEKRK